MFTENEISFARRIILDPPTQAIEEVASQSHETRRLPDTYVYLNFAGKFTTPNGTSVEDKIDRSTPLGVQEYLAFSQIQTWAKNNEGYILWFSPPYEDIYLNSKIIIQQSGTFEGNEKFIINRAVVLDINTDEILKIANSVGEQKFSHPEVLRSTPLFPSTEEFGNWFEKLTSYTEQKDVITKGKDLIIKTDTYAKLTDIQNSVAIVGKDHLQREIYVRAVAEGMIGNNPESCPPLLKTAFNAVFGDSLVVSGESKFVKNCGNCRVSINAVILKGYRCKSCGGEYKGC